MKTRHFAGVLAAALLFGMSYGLATRGKAAGQGTEQPARAAGPLLIAANGVAEAAQREVPIHSEVLGTIAAVHARENQDVVAGALLVELENEDQKALVQLAEGDVEIAQAALEQLRNGERLERRQAVAALARSRENAYKLARDAFERAQQSRDGVSKQEMHRVELQMRQAKEEWDNAKHEHELVEAPPRYEEVRKAEGTVKKAQAQLRKAKADLAKTQLRAPFGCRILRVFPEPGELVSPASSQPVLLLADLSKHRVRAFVEELDVFKVQPGQRVFVTADGLPDKEFTGKVSVVMSRMGVRTLQSESPGEYKDVHAREVMIDLDNVADLPLNLRVRVWIDVREQR